MHMKIIKIAYGPDHMNNNYENFLPQSVEIYKTTDEIILGNYIGENIEMLLIDFIEIPKFFTYKDVDWVYLSYGYNEGNILNVGVDTKENIVTKIHYGYAM